MCNRLSLMSAFELQSMLQAGLRPIVRVFHDKERSVAGAWNKGIQLARSAGSSLYLISAVDVSLTHSTVDILLDYGERHPECDLWSSTPTNLHPTAGREAIDACDFSCVMLRDRTIARHGWFDKEYKPAYFEDNDYVTRVVLGGGAPKQVLTARHEHEGSLTIKLDAEMAHHVNHWFGGNRERFLRKWGALVDDYSRIPQYCHSSPFVSGRELAWWPEQEYPGYSPAGGVHELGIETLATTPENTTLSLQPRLGNSRREPGPLTKALYCDSSSQHSDIHEHLAILTRYGALAEDITEFGTSKGNATSALLMAGPRKLITYDLCRHARVEELARAAKEQGTNFDFVLADTRNLDSIETTDLLFIDTFHSATQLTTELAHASHVRKYVILHDTETFGVNGEDGVIGHGLWPAITKFLRLNPQFQIVLSLRNNNGLTVIERTS